MGQRQPPLDGSITDPGQASGRLALSPRNDLVVGDNRIARHGFTRSAALDLVQGGHISALAFSPDGQTLSVGGDAGTLRLWDTTTQQTLGGPFPTPGEPIRSLAFSPDNTTLLVGGDRVPLQHYPVDPTRATTHACARAGNVALTRAEWETYVPDAPYRRVCG
ncbi:hypothetical protein JIX56_46395 [Streptomyces sp. CA-210063]|uniref:WD40 repeat domain-containing protein n=1 Tax=Streptomyces sp. CA-210063 TaxID=2801029 RepID=UPI00214C78CF|nr:hypothetical protein [Streptomyces sp. CA-210063]UUU36650.1 hypothetical protein JIX56_46395 [Streptomyces sp. CA-210063]